MDVELYDTTLRDGAQQEGISLSVEDKLKITRKLDDLGVHYVEGGWPGSNPKDQDYFRRVRGVSLARARIAAFGTTRRAGITAEADANIRALLAAETPIVTLVGKASDLHVRRVLETTLEENLAMISDSISLLKRRGRTVFFDAEHLFDGFKSNPEYALQCIRAATAAGADCLVLCDTNGGTLPSEVWDTLSRVRQEVKAPLGIHCHNDADMAVANTLAAVAAGATQVQGTINGYGERCGNANLLSIIANLKLKMGIPCVTDGQLASLTEVSHYVSEIVNIAPNGGQPYVGASAFSHKGGLHAAAVTKVEESYQHIPPERVGNAKRVVVSELSGRGNILYRLKELGLDGVMSRGQIDDLLGVIKVQESKGFQYEGAEASFEVMVRRSLEGYRPPFELVDFMVLVENRRRMPSNGDQKEMMSEAVVKVRVGSRVMHTAAEGNGPVNALDNALRKALLEFYPSLSGVKLLDYKVRVVDQAQDTMAIVRVLIESTDGKSQWQTVGASGNIIEASWMALADSLEYFLIRQG
ncbi:MAG: 2-isopropylmalate synthase/homocitrate synthase family protein [Dehalococcoidia bacterium]|nr:2-isopropylmalate synthase/homocitrate synthase family protein [Dehalococcoidia bacterium]